MFRPSSAIIFKLVVAKPNSHEQKYVWQPGSYGDTDITLTITSYTNHTEARALTLVDMTFGMCEKVLQSTVLPYDRSTVK